MTRTALLVTLVLGAMAINARSARADGANAIACGVAAPVAGLGGYLLVRDGISRDFISGGLEGGLGFALVNTGFGMAGCAVEQSFRPYSKRWVIRAGGLGVIVGAPVTALIAYDANPADSTPEDKRHTAYKLGAVSAGIGLLFVVTSFFVPENRDDNYSGTAWRLLPTATNDSTGVAFGGQF
jgi:hypothetical protein